MSIRVGNPPLRSKWTELPLAIAYLAVPMGTAFVGLVGNGSSVSPIAPWLLLAIVGTCLALYNSIFPFERGLGRKIEWGFSLISLAGAFFYGLDLIHFLSPYLGFLKETSPFLYLLLCLLWILSHGLPQRDALLRFGGILSSLILIDSVGEVIFFHFLSPIRLLGNVDVLSGLLLVALCAGLETECAASEEGKEENSGQVWYVLILSGLCACLSPVGLFATFWLVLCFGRGRLRTRMLFGGLCLVCLAVSFILPLTSADSLRCVNYWFWLETLRTIVHNPGLLLTGCTLGMSLPIHLTPQIADVWESATGQSSLFGVYLEQVPSFWLRLFWGWGVGLPLMLVAGVFVLISFRLNRMGAGLTGALFVQGFSTPLLFDPATAITVCFGYIIALSITVPPPSSSELENESLKISSVEDLESEHVKEWDMRPL